MRKILLVLLLTMQAWSMDQNNFPECCKNYGVASLKELATSTISKHRYDHAKTLAKLPLELHELLSHHDKWNRMTQGLFPITVLTIAHASLSPDNNTMLGESDSYGMVLTSRDQTTQIKQLGSYVVSLKDTAWHPDQNKSVLAFAMRNGVSIEDTVNKGRVHLDLQDFENIHTLQWSSDGKCLIVVCNNAMVFIEHDTWNFFKRAGNVPFSDSGILCFQDRVNRDACLSPSGNAALFLCDKPLLEMVNMRDVITKKISLSVPLLQTLSACCFEKDDDETLLLATPNSISSIKTRFSVGFTYGTPTLEYCAVDVNKAIEQIFCINDRHMLIKLHCLANNKRSLTIFDRKLKKSFPLLGAVCEGKTKLSMDKKFAYGNKRGDSLVDLSYLFLSQSSNKLVGQS